MEIRNLKSEIRKKSEPRSSKFSAPRIARRRSAELHSAVSQICNLRRSRNPKAVGKIARLAECNSAIQQIENLRYNGFASRHALLHFQSSGAAHKRAFTGLFTT